MNKETMGRVEFGHSFYSWRGQEVTCKPITLTCKQSGKKPKSVTISDRKTRVQISDKGKLKILSHDKEQEHILVKDPFGTIILDKESGHGKKAVQLTTGLILFFTILHQFTYKRVQWIYYFQLIDYNLLQIIGHNLLQIKKNFLL